MSISTPAQLDATSAALVAIDAAPDDVLESLTQALDAALSVYSPLRIDGAALTVGCAVAAMRAWSGTEHGAVLADYPGASMLGLAEALDDRAAAAMHVLTVDSVDRDPGRWPEAGDSLAYYRSHLLARLDADPGARAWEKQEPHLSNTARANRNADLQSQRRQAAAA